MLHTTFRAVSRTAAAVGVLGLGCFMAACGSAGGGSSSGSPGYDPSASSGGSSSSGGSGAWGGSGGSSTGSGNTNVNLSGSQDFGYFRAQLDNGAVPEPGSYTAAGFFAEHHSQLPDPVCGERICLQALLGVMGNLTSGENCTMLQLGLNSPVVADPSDRPPLNLSVVIDTSGSMAQRDKIDYVQNGLELLIDELRDGDKLALVTYSDSVSVPFPMAELSTNRGQVRQLVSNLAATGGTNIYAGLQTGYEELLQNYDSGRQNRVIFLSDGLATSGITGTGQILDMSKAYNSDGLGITTVGLGDSFNQELMRDLALQADGNFYFLENTAAVSEVFTEEISYFTVPVAYDLKLELNAGAHYQFGRAYGSPFWADTSGGGKLEVPSLFLAHRESDDDVHQGSGRRGGGSALMVELMPALANDGSNIEQARVASIDIQFREPGTNEIVTDKVDVIFPHAPWVTPERGFFSSPDGDPATIQKSFVMLNVFVGMDQACRAFHEGGDAEAQAGALTRLIEAVRDYNDEVQDTDITLDLELLEQLRSVMLDNGVEPEDVAVPADPWPAD